MSHFVIDQFVLIRVIHVRHAQNILELVADCGSMLDPW